jgi:hypothetical protein
MPFNFLPISNVVLRDETMIRSSCLRYRYPRLECPEIDIRASGKKILRISLDSKNDFPLTDCSEGEKVISHKRAKLKIDVTKSIRMIIDCRKIKWFLENRDERSGNLRVCGRLPQTVSEICNTNHPIKIFLVKYWSACESKLTVID